MTGRRFLVAAGLVLGLGLLGLGFGVWVTTPAHRINRTSFHAIAVGWTEGEVGALVRAPAGVYAAPSTAVRVCRENEHLAGAFTADNLVAPPERARCRAWVSDQGAILVRFDAAGRVEAKQFFECDPDGVLAKVRRWVRGD